MPKPSPRKRAAPLADLQRTVTDALQRPLTAEDGMQPRWIDGSPMAEFAARIIKPNDRLTAFERLEIYNQQYWWRLLGAFGEDFRGLRAVLGSKAFDRLAGAYLTSCPSTSWTLRNLGSKLTAFLAQHPELTHPRSALALDVAAVEWARVLAFDDPELPPLDPAHIAGTPAHRLRLGLQPHLNLLTLSHPVDELMRKLRRREVSAMSNAVAATQSRRAMRLSARRSSAPIYLAVHRVNFSVYYKPLEPEAHQLLQLLRAGVVLDEACAQAFAESKEKPEASAARIQEWFARWMELGWFCAR